MNIPLSAIEPFGVTGFPSLINSADAISNALDNLFKTMCEHTTIDDVAIDTNIFCQLAGIKVIAMGSKDGTVTLSNEMRGKENKLLAVTITVAYQLAKGKWRTKVYTVNPLGVFRIKRDSCNPFHAQR